MSKIEVMGGEEEIERNTCDFCECLYYEIISPFSHNVICLFIMHAGGRTVENAKLDWRKSLTVFRTSYCRHIGLFSTKSSTRSSCIADIMIS